jgi:hypothetical protein
MLCRNIVIIKKYFLVFKIFRRKTSVKTGVLPVFYFLLFLYPTEYLLAGNQENPLGGRSAGMSHASVMLTDGWCCFNNQAGLGFLNKPSCGFYFENKYNISEFSTQAVFCALPFKPGTIGMDVRYFGYSLYNECKIGLAYGKKLTKRFAFGVQANYLQSRFGEDYGSTHSLAAELGLLYEPVDNMHIGLQWFKPSASDEKTGLNKQTIRFGVSYFFAAKALIAVETFKEMNEPVMIKLGVEINVLKNLYARTGFATNINNYSFGLGYNLKIGQLDLSVTNNRLLGFTPQASLSVNFK